MKSFCRFASIFAIGAILLQSDGYAAFEFKETGAHAAALSGAFAARSSGVAAIDWNPAGLRQMDQIECASFYRRLFSLENLTYAGTSLALPASFGNFGIAYHQFGDSAYQEKQWVFSHGFQWTRRILLGYSVKGMFLKLDEFGSTFAFGADAGILILPSENWRIGFSAKNFNHPAIGASDESLPHGFAAGLAFRPIDAFWFSGDLVQVNEEISVKAGVEYQWVPAFSVRAGFQNRPAKFSCGFGVKAGSATLDYAYQNGNLAGEHQFTIGFKFGHPSKK